jgi:hypothetical protein
MVGILSSCFLGRLLFFVRRRLRGYRRCLPVQSRLASVDVWRYVLQIEVFGGCMAYQRVSLKVCEGCGTLWIRELRTGVVYCRPCAELLQDFPDPKTRRRAGRPKKDRSGEGFAAQALSAFGGAQ